MNTIIMEVNSGVVTPVSAPKGTEIQVRDYDVEGFDEDTLVQDKNGNLYKLITFSF